MESLDIEETMVSRRHAMQWGLAGLALATPFGAFAKRAETAFLPHVTALLDGSVGPGKFPGIVVSLGLPGQDARFVARGSEGLGDKDRVTADSLFRIYSMTKPITGMAAMLLIDEGKLGLDQPLGDILPKFARMNVQVTPDGSITDVRPAKGPITIRHLLTHTAGLGYSFVQKGPLRAAMEEAGVVPYQISRKPTMVMNLGSAKPASSLERFADAAAALPLVNDPGTVWSYSISLDLLGRVIEVVSGRPFDRFLEERIFGPAGMNSTFFQVPSAEAHRLTSNYSVEQGKLEPLDPAATSIYLDPPAFPFGGAGLVSSPRDYDRFLRLLAQYGRIDGRQVMGERAVRIGTSNLLPEGVDTKMMPAMGAANSGFGAGGRVGLGAEAGIFGWGGAAGTNATVDMKRGVRNGLFIQLMPPDALPLHGDYNKALLEDMKALGGTLHS